tara:strand:+ start:1368 stop:2039 length:672 start_codon:yes stop_codon:yes gene_type:complete
MKQKVTKTGFEYSVTETLDRGKDWKGWNELPIANEGHTGKYVHYQEYLYNLIKELSPKNILEIGFNVGHSACCFLNSSPSAKMFTFDICQDFPPESKERNIPELCVWIGTTDRELKIQAYNVLKSHFDITLIEGDSTKTVPDFLENNNIKFDFVFVDGWHEEPVPYIDMINTKGSVAPGGLLIVDDFGYPPVRNSFEKVNWEGFETETARGIEKEIKILKKKS